MQSQNAETLVSGRYVVTPTELMSTQHADIVAYSVRMCSIQKHTQLHIISYIVACVFVAISKNPCEQRRQKRS